MMGGSLGLSLRKRRAPYRIIGIGRNIGRLRKAKRLGACDDVTTDYKKGVKDADVIVVCTTVKEIVPSVMKALPYLKAGSVITDIGSVKAPILDGVRVIPGAPSWDFFVGGHPLAGSEKTGLDHSNKDLYLRSTVVLCPITSLIGPSLPQVERLWESAGAGTMVMEPDVHDILVAQTSHLPHVLAAAFVQLLKGLEGRDKRTARLLAGSFRDLTRIVDSDSRHWAEIAGANRKFIFGAIKSYRDVLLRILEKTQVSQDPEREWESFFSSARESRLRLLSGSSATTPAKK